MSTTPTPPPSQAAIHARAQAIWEAAGRPEGSALDHWLQAERELSDQQGPGTPSAPPANPTPPPPKDLAEPKRRKGR